MTAIMTNLAKHAFSFIVAVYISINLGRYAIVVISPFHNNCSSNLEFVMFYAL